MDLFNNNYYGRYHNYYKLHVLIFIIMHCQLTDFKKLLKFTKMGVCLIQHKARQIK